MSLLVQRIVLILAVFVLPAQSWAAAFASDCVMTIRADAPAHCCHDKNLKNESNKASQKIAGLNSHHAAHEAMHMSSIEKSSANKQLADKQITKECLAGASCHCQTLYSQVTPPALIAPIKVAISAFSEIDHRFIAIIHPPLWRPPITV